MGTHRRWIHTTNTFMVHGLRDYKLALELIIFTDDMLLQESTDPDILILYNYLHPLRQAQVNEYNQWNTQKGTQKGATLSLDNLLFGLGSNIPQTNTPSKINEWDLNIQAAGSQFHKGTPGYIAIFPQGHQPFQTGDKTTRIEAVNSLSLALTGIAALAAVKADVDAYYVLLTSARTVQEGMIGQTDVESGEVLISVVAGMTGLWSVLGGLIRKYPSDPDIIEGFFKVELVRDLAQTVFERSIPANGEIFIAKRTLPPGSKMKMTVVTIDAVDFYIAAEKNDPVRTKKVTVQGEEDETAEVQLLQETADSTFIKAKNISAIPAQIRIEILPEGS